MNTSMSHELNTERGTAATAAISPPPFKPPPPHTATAPLSCRSHYALRVSIEHELLLNNAHDFQLNFTTRFRRGFGSYTRVAILGNPLNLPFPQNGEGFLQRDRGPLQFVVANYQCRGTLVRVRVRSIAREINRK